MYPNDRVIQFSKPSSKQNISGWEDSAPSDAKSIEILSKKISSSYEKMPSVEPEFRRDNIFLLILNRDIEKICAAIERDPQLIHHVRKSDGFTPLICAVFHGAYQIVEIFLQAGADIHMPDKKMHTPLIWAALYDYPHIIKILLLQGARLFDRTQYGQTALDCAVENGNTRSEKILIDIDFSKSEEDFKSVFPLRYRQKMTLLEAAHTGDIFFIKMYLQEKLNPNITDEIGRSAIYWAAFNGSLEIVRLLETAGANLSICDKNRRNALMMSCYSGNQVLIDFFLSHRHCLENYRSLKDFLDTPDAYGEPPLIWAAKKGHAAIMKYLLGLGASPHFVTSNGTTLLMLCAIQGLSEIVQMLLNVDVDTRLVDSQGFTAITAAQKNTKIDSQIIVQMIEDHQMTQGILTERSTPLTYDGSKYPCRLS